MAKWQVATAAALLLCAACATAQPFTLTSGASVTTNITTLTTSGQFVKVSTSALGQCLLLLLLLLLRYLVVAWQHLFEWPLSCAGACRLAHPKS